jgi:hypothetical protein
MPTVTTPIDRPAQYLTRKGEIANIVSAHQTPNGQLWSGWIARTQSNGNVRKQWSEWNASGLFGCIAPGATRAFDIIGIV